MTNPYLARLLTSFSVKELEYAQERLCHALLHAEGPDGADRDRLWLQLLAVRVELTIRGSDLAGKDSPRQT